METRILLVRHGQVDANLTKVWHGSTDSDLTPHGIDQAERLAEYFGRAPATARALYTSPLRRARDTAAPLGRVLGLVPMPLPGLTEFDIGALEGLPFIELTQRHRFFERTAADLAWAPPGGESLGAVGARVLAAWRHVATMHAGQEAIAVSHSAAIAAGLALLLHNDVREWRRYHVRNSSVTTIVLDPTPMLQSFDRVDHLPL